MVQLLIYSLAQLMAAAYSCPLVQKTWQQGTEREQLRAVRSGKERCPKETHMEKKGKYFKYVYGCLGLF